MTHQNKIVGGLAAVCAIAWIIAAIHPLDRPAWILENILLLLFVVAIALAHRRLQLSDISYVFIALFIILHIIGAHYTYVQMPLGLWAKNFFAFSRNHFDRVGHFAFGCFLVFPIRELLVRFSGIRGPWTSWLAVAVILAVSGLFEILESIVAEIIAPGKGIDWLGGQGDEWDAQNDMASAMLGALFMTALVALTNRKTYGLMNSPKTLFSRNRFLQLLVAFYLLFWVALAISPLDRQDWLLENLLVFVTATVLVPTYRRFQLSNVSYVLIVVFLAVHAVGAHYTYAKVPAGFWLADWLHLKRNHYDRVIHFAFGFLLLYPMRELLRRAAGARQTWDAWLGVAALAALSSFFEILEAIIAQIVRPDLGAAYLGTQGDVWDAQKDMMAAFVGALLAAGTVTAIRRPKGAP